jgi:predicted permease
VTDGPRWRRYLRFWGDDPAADVDDELRFHLDMKERELVRAGMDPDVARREALEHFGSLRRVRAECEEIAVRRTTRDQRAESFGTMSQDARFALRQLRRSPGFAIATALTLALGIGANVVIFALVDATVLRPLPGVREPERLLEITIPSISYPSYVDFRDQTPGLAGLAAFRERPMALVDGDRSELITGAVVSGNYFALLGAGASVGRVIGEGDDRPDAPPVVVLSHRIWRRLFNEDPGIPGRTVRLNGRPVTIVGVASREFRGSRLRGVPDLWVPVHAMGWIAPTSLDALDINQRSWSWLTAIGRLAPGVSVEQAATALNVVAERQEQLYPTETRTGFTVRAFGARAAAGGAMNREASVRFTAMLVGVVAIVLLIACANVANLLLARAAWRRREIAVRLSLGASRGRLVRQLVTESAVLALVAGGAGVVLSVVGIGALARLTLPGGVSLHALELEVGGRVLAFALAVTVTTVVLFGIAPALQASSLDPALALKDGGHRGGSGRSRLRDGLLVTQVALSMLLLIGTGLFTRALQRALAIDPGVELGKLATISVNLGLARYDSARAGAYYDAVTERVARVPGVARVAWSATLPLGEESLNESFVIPGYQFAPDENTDVEVSAVSPGFLATAGIPLRRGRDFTPDDGEDGDLRVIVNETMARRYWPERDAIGQRFTLVTTAATIIGVARDAKYHDLLEPPKPFVYVPLSRRLRTDGLSVVSLVARANGDPETILGGVQSAVRSRDPSVPTFELTTYESRLADLLAAQRLGVAFLGAFAVLATVVAAVGIYGVVSFVVGQRRREMGIRLALGARPAGVVRLVLAHGLSRVLLGLVVGVLASAAAARVVSRFLYGVPPTDPVTYAGTAVLLAVVALLAASFPARAAARTDPATTLRAE